MICQGCEQEKDVTNIEGYLLCGECAEDIVRCDFCNRFLASSMDELEVDNFGRLDVPELALPDKQSHLIFCNLDCLDAYLKKYRQAVQYLINKYKGKDKKTDNGVGGTGNSFQAVTMVDMKTGEEPKGAPIFVIKKRKEKGEIRMVRYARLVFEEEVEDNATEEEIVERIGKAIENYIAGFGISIDDIEISETPYEGNV